MQREPGREIKLHLLEARPLKPSLCTHSLNAARKLGGGTAGKLFITAGLGGMSGAQPKAGDIAGVVSITAEINPAATQKRYDQGWVDEVHADLDELFVAVNKAREQKIARSFAYQGNVVDLWEYCAKS